MVVAFDPPFFEKLLARTFLASSGFHGLNSFGVTHLFLPVPTDEEIVNHMNSNYCRCMAYTRIKKAIKRAATSSVEYFDPNASKEGENA